MKKFCFFFPLVESGIVVGICGIILWVLYLCQASLERNLKSNSLLLAAYASLTVIGIGFEFVLIYAFIKVKLFLIKVWRVYQIFLVAFLTVTWIYDIADLSNGSDIFVFVTLDALFLGLEIYFMIVVRAFQNHLEIINEPEIGYHPVNEIDNAAFINDYY